MAWGLSVAARNAAGKAITDLVDAGSGAGTIEIRSGSRPAAPADTATGTLLATVTCQDPSFGTWSSGQSTYADPAGVTAVATGTASWCRVKDSTGAVVMDGTVTATGGGGDLTLASTSISSGQTVDLTGGTLSMPQGG
jgi:hypothetical protein